MAATQGMHGDARFLGLDSNTFAVAFSILFHLTRQRNVRSRTALAMPLQMH